jgi:hypothetical protein
MRKKNLVKIFTCLSIISVEAAFSASYTDENAWRTAVGGYALENFDAIADNTELSLLPSLGVRFAALNDGSFPTVQSYSRTGGIPKSGPHNLLNDADFSLPGRGPYRILPLNATESIYGVGLWNVGGDDQLKLSFFNSNGRLIEEVISASGTGFFGIYNALGATSAVIDFVGGNGYAPVDDLQISGTTVVPVPATFWLFGSGLLALAWFRRASKK